MAPFRLKRLEEPRASNPGSIRLSLPTDLDAIEEAVDLIARHCLEAGLGARTARFNLRVALSEALANAVKYGNRFDPAKRIEVDVMVSKTHVNLHIRDQGPGFDPDTVPDPTLPDRLQEPDGRGLFLIRNLVEDVSFNERGNSICMTLRRG